MNRLKRFIGTHLILYLSILILSSYADVEFCNRLGADGIYWINQSNCEFGILFPQPVLIDCIASTNTGDLKADVCNDKDVTVGSSPTMLQYISNNEAAAIDESKSCNKPEKCGSQSYIDDPIWAERILEPPILHTNYPWPDLSTGNQSIPLVVNQTYRLFKHLMGFTDDKDGRPNLRIITLLKKSFQILGKFCKNRYVPLEFGEDVLDAFLFLFAESDSTRIMDVNIDEFKLIDAALNDCLDQENPFTVIGNTCKTYPTIEQINTTNGFVRFVPNEFSWTPEKYDLPVDVTWATTDFVHGLCYGTFKSHVNSHHLYQQAIERIFTPEIIARWDKPVILARQHVWDNFFSANVRSTIENLEYCIQAAYDDAPFLHRLERMVRKFEGSNSSTTAAPATRKKRDVETTPLPDEMPAMLPSIEKVRFYCFRTEEEREATLEKYKSTQCSDSE